MNKQLVYRVTLLSLHVFLNFFLISYLLNFDWTGSWLRFFLFVLIVLLLFVLFVRHLLSFVLFIKTKT